MRKFTFLLLVISTALTVQNASAQITNWSPLKRLTTGYKDTNPAFGPSNTFSSFIYKWEFLVFQRAVDTSSQICVVPLNTDGPIDTIRYLTTGNYKHRNPAIAYRIISGDSLKNAIAVWETNRNGKWDIYGAYYNSASGWGSPFPIDTTAGNKFSPVAMMYTANEFGIVYTRGDDIIHTRINAASQTVLNEINLTGTLSASCNSPLIGQPFNAPLTVSFRCAKPDSTFGIYKIISSNNGASWINLDTVTTIANNRNVQVAVGFSNAMHIFESNRAGKSGIYAMNPGFSALEVIHSSTVFNYYGLKTWFYPIITDVINSQVSTVIRKSSDSTKILFNTAGLTTVRDSVSIGDASKNVSIALNNGLRYANYFYFYSVFNMDSAGYTSLYYKTRAIYSTGITSLGNAVPEGFNLYQNYPNPFNPTTKIKFDIPKLSNVKIIIFDAVGREVKNVIQNNMATGSYEYEFNGESLSSGIYYFKLETNDFAKTVKMVLLK